MDAYCVLRYRGGDLRRGPGTGMSRKEPALLAGFPSGGRVRSLGAPPATGAEEEMPGDRDHHPVQARCRRRPDVDAAEPATRRRAEHRRHQPAHIVLQPMEGTVQYKTDHIT